MNTEKTVFNKITKESNVNLNIHQLKLGISEISGVLSDVKNIEKTIQSAEGKAKKADKLFREAAADVKELKKIYTSNKKDIDMANKSLNKSFDEIYKAAKSIGVDIKEVPAYRDYLVAKKIADDSFKANQSFWNIVANYS
jgi:peptidoglycan hydrolase CwlO-like protein